MRRQIESAVPPSSDLRASVTRFENETREMVGDRIEIAFDLPDGSVQVSADPREVEELFSNLVVNVEVLMSPGGRLTVHLSPDGFENMPDEVELSNPSRWMHLAIEDRGSHSVAMLLRRLLDPLINVASQLAGRNGLLRWDGRILFDDGDDASRVIHLLLPYAAERLQAH